VDVIIPPADGKDAYITVIAVNRIDFSMLCGFVDNKF